MWWWFICQWQAVVLTQLLEKKNKWNFIITRKHVSIPLIIRKNVREFENISNIKNFRWHFFCRHANSPQQILPNNNDSLKAFKTGPMYIVIDGFLSTFKTTMSQLVKDSLLKSRPNGNVIIVDWSKLSGSEMLNLDENTPYPQLMMAYNVVKTKVGLVGKKVAKFLAQLAYHNVTEFSKVHVIGYSLGAHGKLSCSLRLTICSIRCNQSKRMWSININQSILCSCWNCWTACYWKIWRENSTNNRLGSSRARIPDGKRKKTIGQIGCRVRRHLLHKQVHCRGHGTSSRSRWCVY